VTFRDACARLGVLPGASQEQALRAAGMRLLKARADWKETRTLLNKAEDELVEAKEILSCLTKGEDK